MTDPYKEDEELSLSQELKNMHQKTSGRALELEAGDELPNNVEEHSTGKLRTVWEIWVISVLFPLQFRFEMQRIELPTHLRTWFCLKGDLVRLRALLRAMEFQGQYSMDKYRACKHRKH